MALLLNADLDGELDAGQSAALAEHLASCPACASLQADLQTLGRSLRADLPYHTAPRTWHTAFAPASPRWRLPAALAAAALAASLMLALLPRTDDTDIVSAHLRALQPGHLIDIASSDRHNVKPWFDGRLDYAPPVKDLAADGFPLAGGRLDVLGGHPIAALVYRRQQHVIDVFARPGDRLLKSPGAQGYNIVAWRQDGFAFLAISDLNADELHQFSVAWQSAR
jgi:anti-sigma factor RsiW